MNPFLRTLFSVVAIVSTIPSLLPSTAVEAHSSPLARSASSAISMPKIAPPWRQPPVIWQPPRLVLPNPNRTDSAIQIQTIRIHGEVNGRQAMTEIDMTFFNPNNRVLEGELQFPLLDGQRVASFAMDVNGVLRDAVPIEKAKGQAVFEDVIRARIDPGLLEVTQGNNFKLRVYPIPAQGTKRVVIQVAQTLDSVRGQSFYQLPLGFGERVATLVLSVNINGSDKAPEVGKNGFGDIAFSRDTFGSRYRLRESRNNFTGSGSIEFMLMPSTTASAVQTELFEGKHYFVADIPLAMREAAREIPKSVGLIWDSSASARTRSGDGALEAALLDAYFKKMRDGVVRLTRIRDAAEPAQTFRIVNGDWHALREALAATAYDGATNLGAFVPEANVREYLLFSDGLSNFGEQPFAQTRVPLYSISASVKADPVFLKHIAQRSGGHFIDLTKETTTSAAHALLSTATRVVEISSADASQLVMTALQGERIQVAGILSGNNRGNGNLGGKDRSENMQAMLQLKLQHPDGQLENRDIPINAVLSEENSPTARSNMSTTASTWAQLRINELDAEYALNRAEIRRLGQRFGLVTRETSLIILDRVEDYARYEIQPPAELRAEFDRVVGNISKQRRLAQNSHLENIVRAFEQKVAWWNHDYPKDSRPENKYDKYGQRVQKSAIAAGNFQSADSRESPRRAEMMSPLVQSSPTAPMVAEQVAAQAAAQAANRTRTSSDLAAAPQFAKMGERNNEADDQTYNRTYNQASIRLQKWQPDAPYANRLRYASQSDLYRVYLDEAPSYSNSTAFYLDAADVFFEKGLSDLGVRVLSNLAEMDLENRHILRILGYRLMQANRPALAIPAFKKVLLLSPEEPQSYRDLGLAYASDKQAQKAIDALYEVVIRPWNGRFPEVELIALADMNAIIATSNARLDTSRVDPRLLKNMALDLRAVLTWDADNTDIDLWVTDPNDEKAYYGHRFTDQGGRMSLDFTSGYGPEEFSLKSAKPGKYRVEAQYFGDRRQNITGATTLQVRLTTGFGTRQQREQIITMRLKDNKETIFVGEFEIKGGR